MARTETGSASNFGSRAAAGEAGMKSKSWISAGDEKVRDSHARLDAQTTKHPIPIDKPFDLGRNELMYPWDGSLGADAGEIINCRCTVLYYAE